MGQLKTSETYKPLYPATVGVSAPAYSISPKPDIKMKICTKCEYFTKHSNIRYQS